MYTWTIEGACFVTNMFAVERRWDNNIEMDVKEVGLEGIDLIFFVS